VFQSRHPHNNLLAVIFVVVRSTRGNAYECAT
jgi:hypothetical protein